MNFLSNVHASTYRVGQKEKSRHWLIITKLFDPTVSLSTFWHGMEVSLQTYKNLLFFFAETLQEDSLNGYKGLANEPKWK